MNRAARRALLHGIYAIVDEGPDTIAIAAAALCAGIRIVQYRAKGGIVAAHARRLRELTNESRALFILNDDWSRVDEFAADGVHLGPDDASPAEYGAIRAKLREGIVGISCGEVAEVRACAVDEIDYVGAGSVYETQSKDDAGTPIGIAGLLAIVSSAPVPVAAIGGISAGRIAGIRSAGAAMAAVLSALLPADRTEQAALELVHAWQA